MLTYFDLWYMNEDAIWPLLRMRELLTTVQNYNSSRVVFFKNAKCTHQQKFSCVNHVKVFKCSCGLPFDMSTDIFHLVVLLVSPGV